MPEARVISLGGMSPQISSSAYLADGVVIAGDVSIGSDSSVWFNAVIRGEYGTVRVGNRSNVQDCAVLHSDPGFPCIVHDDVTIGHGAVVHGCTVGSGAIIGMGAILLNGAKVGEDAIVAAGAVVTEGFVINPGTVVAGVPAKVKRQLEPNERQQGREAAARYVEKAENYRAEAATDPVSVG
jgi:carbonic anhydrase/acetyltransferase-like protein (isoleucine patch superfamily)